MSIDLDGEMPLSVQIADILVERIAAGEIGRRLPSVRAIAGEFDVAHATAAHAVQELTRRGVVKTTPGRGTFVQRPKSPGEWPEPGEARALRSGRCRPGGRS